MSLTVEIESISQLGKPLNEYVERFLVDSNSPKNTRYNTKYTKIYEIYEIYEKGSCDKKLTNELERQNQESQRLGNDKFAIFNYNQQTGI